jgi:hypothetical protein
MGNNKEIRIENQFDLTCSECGVGNLKKAKNSILCGKNIDYTVVFLKDDTFDLGIPKNTIIAYKKGYWG